MTDDLAASAPPLRRYFAPSPLNADHAHLADQVALVEDHVEALHLDFMDGHFVPALAFAPAVVRDLKKVTHLPLRCHLMVSAPDQFVDTFADHGADLLTVHHECGEHARDAIRRARERGMKAGLALKLETPVAAAEEMLDQLDSLLIMSIVPGRSGQPFRDEALGRIEEARAMVDRSGLEIDIEVDGGVNEETGRRCIAAGATILAADSVVFRAEDPTRAAKAMAGVAAGA
ncbi:MAG TPA: ribulose-phosphate 3-epimerase [Solirubrobacterales bacterium]|nr:ribulose-phosphate 3-epimerase [Solirubrobacterales bacterium]